MTDGTACQIGGICCGGACVDPNTDHANCGGCGKACSAITVCTGGTCQRKVTLPQPTVAGATLCGAGQTDCGGGNCVDLATDAANCGACGNACAAGQVCFGGTCANDHR